MDVNEIRRLKELSGVTEAPLEEANPAYYKQSIMSLEQLKKSCVRISTDTRMGPSVKAEHIDRMFSEYEELHNSQPTPEAEELEEAPVEENFIDEMPHGLLDGMTFTDGSPDYDHRGNPMNNGEVDWPEINEWHLDADGNVKPEATIKPEDFEVSDLVPF